MASFDTTAAELEALTAELGVKALPQFRFYQVGWQRCRAAVRFPAWRLCRAGSGFGGVGRPLGSWHAPNSAAPLPCNACAQGGKEVGSKIMGYKLQALAEAFKNLDSQ